MDVQQDHVLRRTREESVLNRAEAAGAGESGRFLNERGQAFARDAIVLHDHHPDPIRSEQANPGVSSMSAARPSRVTRSTSTIITRIPSDTTLRIAEREFPGQSTIMLPAMRQGK